MNKYDWSNKEQILLDLTNITNMSKFLINNNMTATSGNFHTFKKWMKIHEINIEHFVKKVDCQSIVLKERDTIANEKIFSKNSSYRKEAKLRIVKEKLIPYVCQECGNTGEWNGKSLTLQLDHKNGDNTDNRLENLEYLCPNCHSQTSTYGSKNTHNKIFETRIKDLIEIKNIEEKSILVLMTRWNVSYNSVKYWIHKHIDKISFYNVKIIANKNFSRYRENEDIKIIKEVAASDFSIVAIQKIAESNNTLASFVRKRVKKLTPEIYKKLEASITDKNLIQAKKIQTNRLNYLNNINSNNFNLKEMQEYFKMELEGLMPWILKHDKNLYVQIKSPLIRCCTNCQSMNIKKKGTIENDIVLQKYQCKDCNKVFNYVKEIS
jgi:Zn finger protein HypA/HybF involved in hydrogenase expression